jgi:hypothetical protein
MSALLDSLALLAQPWADLFNDSAAAQVAVGFLHLAGLLVAGGLALAADRVALRERDPAPEDRARIARELERTHAPVLIGLVVVVVSGFALLAADVEALLPSAAFWIKMAAFAALLANGALLRRAGRRLLEPGSRGPAAWRTLRLAAMRSAALWGVVLLLGSLLTVTA